VLVPAIDEKAIIAALVVGSALSAAVTLGIKFAQPVGAGAKADRANDAADVAEARALRPAYAAARPIAGGAANSRRAHLADRAACLPPRRRRTGIALDRE
jgi:hypothetical protein